MSWQLRCHCAPDACFLAADTLLTRCATGEDVTVDMEKNVLINHTTGKEYELKALGDVSLHICLLSPRVLSAQCDVQSGWLVLQHQYATQHACVPAAQQ